MECSMTFSGINYGRRLRSANGVNHSRSMQIFQFGLLPCKTSQAHHEERDLAWGQLWTSACLTQNIHSTIRKRLGTALQSDGKKQKWVQRQKRERRERICIMISMRLRRHIKERKEKITRHDHSIPNPSSSPPHPRPSSSSSCIRWGSSCEGTGAANCEEVLIEGLASMGWESSVGDQEDEVGAFEAVGAGGWLVLYHDTRTEPTAAIFVPLARAYNILN